MAEASEEVTAAIRMVIAGQDAGWSAGDAAAFGAAALPDIVFTNILGLFTVGIEPFNAQHAHIFATIYLGSAMTQELVHVTMASDDVAVVDSLARVTGYHHLPPGVAAIDGALTTRLEQVMVRRDAEWRVQSFHNVPVNAAALDAMARPPAGGAE